MTDRIEQIEGGKRYDLKCVLKEFLQYIDDENERIAVEVDKLNNTNGVNFSKIFKQPTIEELVKWL